jgi:hypothetical protein
MSVQTTFLDYGNLGQLMNWLLPLDGPNGEKIFPNFNLQDGVFKCLESLSI